MAVTVRPFGKTAKGEEINEYILKNSSGMEARLIDFGAILTVLKVPDKNGRLVDVVCGYDGPEGYMVNPGCFGATVGRHANRIAGAAFELNGKVYQLSKNDGPNNLHSNPGSYYFRMWNAKPAGEDSVEMSLSSPDGDQGFPGNMDITVTFTLTEENGFVIRYHGVSDADTLFNMTNHSYFNLSGHDSGNILDQKIQIFADCYTPGSAQLIPTGEIAPVDGTPFDFREMKKVGQDIYADNEQLKNGSGYDHNFVLREGEGCRLAAIMESDETGIAMKVFTDLPGMQLYTASCLDAAGGKGGCHYGQYAAACFETQFFPDSIHHSNFPCCVLKAGKEFNSVTEYRFSLL